MVNEMRLVFFAVAVTLMFLTSAANATGGAMTIATVPVVPDFVNGPFGVAVDSAGNLYIANEYGGSYILKVSTATGAMAIVAGYPGLLTPMGVAVDSAGNLYIADNELNLIAEVPAAGGFITVAGCGSDSYCAPSEQPSLGVVVGKPTGVATDAAGNFYYVAQSAPGSYPSIAEVDQYGEIVGHFGRGWPDSVAVDSAGNVYNSDSLGNLVWKVAAGTGAATIVAGNGTAGFSGDGGPATEAELNGPIGVAVDSGGDIYIADSGNNRVRRVDGNSGEITTLAGNGTAGFSGDGGPATEAELNNPTGVAVDSAGNVFIADFWNSLIRVVTAPLDISASCTTGNGTITQSPAAVNYGDSVTFTITPAAGYHLSSLTDNGVNIAWAAVWDPNQGVYTYTTPYVTSSHTIVATFAPGPYAPQPASVPALSTVGSVLLMLALGGILWRRKRGSQNPRTTSGHGME